jgi:F0F1-type ATP synthase delta subunit
MKSDFYGQALAAALEGKPKIKEEELVANLIRLIKKNGDWTKRKEIVQACEKVLRKKRDRQELVVESARPLREKEKKLLLADFPEESYDVREEIKPELLAGVRLVKDGERQFDASLQNKLKAIFAGLNR